MKPTSNIGHTPIPTAARGVDAGLTDQPPSINQTVRQRVGTSEAAGVLANPRPAAPAGQPRAAAEPLPQGSQHSVATVRHSNARPRAQSFDDVVQVRHFQSSAPARNHSGDSEMPLRNAAHLEPPRRVRRAPPEPQPVAQPPQPAAPAASRWDDNAEARATPASRSGLPTMPVRRPDREDDGNSP